FFGGLYGIRGAELSRRVERILAAVGLEDKAGDRVRTFSGGMKRRLNLGIALVHGPRLLLLDEPTVGVDPQSRNHIFEEVRRLNGEGITLVYTSHYMEEVQALCGRIGIMDGGRLEACDTLPRLLQLLPGTIRFRVATLTPSLREQLKMLPGISLNQKNAEAITTLGREQFKTLPGVSLSERDGRPLELECADVKGALVELMRVLQQARAELVSLDIEETNLERVFLHLTGRALRD
ncbi:MAG TPA: ABC transporter ATP-binding protein, partial [Gemmataceae bacterium]